VNGAEIGRFRLDPEVRAYKTRISAAQELLVEIDSPTWNEVGEPAEQGVRVDRLAVAPAG
jgi:hypothetical protein